MDTQTVIILFVSYFLVGILFLIFSILIWPNCTVATMNRNVDSIN
jgi:hypothetical protein